MKIGKGKGKGKEEPWTRFNVAPEASFAVAQSAIGSYRQSVALLASLGADAWASLRANCVRPYMPWNPTWLGNPTGAGNQGDIGPV